MTVASTETPTSDREIVVSRTIQAPRPLVFEMYTKGEHLAHWWGPYGFTLSTRAFDFRPGGVWDFVMHGPDGTDYPNWVEWREISPPERIVLLHGLRADDPEAFTTTVTLNARDDATEILMRTLFKTKEQRDEVEKRYRALEGAKQTLGRLTTYVAKLGERGR